MKSMVEYIYPRMVWREGEKLLWNPIHRKALKNRPEERVRLRIIESLVAAGWSKHRISTEESIGKLSDAAMRTDIICYNQQFEPRILIECKAEHIPITVKTAEQVARYNQKVAAPFLMLTNGRTDFWYKIEHEKISQLNQPPRILNEKSSSTGYLFMDWEKRGFAGVKASPPLRKWFEQWLPLIWFSKECNRIQFLNFSQSLTDLDLSHYYYLRTISKEQKMAVTTVSTPFGGSRLVAVLNENQKNRAVLEVNLDLLFDGQKANASIYSEDGIATIDFRSYCDLTQIEELPSLFEGLQKLFAE